MPSKLWVRIRLLERHRSDRELGAERVAAWAGPEVDDALFEMRMAVLTAPYSDASNRCCLLLRRFALTNSSRSLTRPCRERAVADHGVHKHEGENEKALSSEHEGKTRVWRRGVRDGDGDGEGNHVGPERDRERAEGRRENKRDHVEVRRGAHGRLRQVRSLRPPRSPGK
jgi:hypothetical protein